MPIMDGKEAFPHIKSYIDNEICQEIQKPVIYILTADE